MAKKNEAKNLDGMEDILDAVEQEADSGVKTEETGMKDTETVTESVEEVNASIDMSEEINALFEGVDFPTEFKDKTKVIFEATVKTKVDAIVAEKLPALIEEKSQEMAATMAEHIDTLYTRLDNFMDAMAEQWYVENEVAVVSNVKADLAEGFLAGLKGLFESSYVTLPEDKVDLYQEEKEKNEKLSAMLESTMATLSEKNDMISSIQKRDLIKEHTVGMTELDVEKFTTLAENVEFSDPDSYTDKLATIKNTFFKNTISEGTNDDTGVLEIVVEDVKSVPRDEIDYLATSLGKFKL